MKKFLLVLLCLALGVMFSLSSEKQQLQAQQSYCPVKGIKKEGTGIVYCFDVGASTCHVMFLAMEVENLHSQLHQFKL